ncbi:MAG: YiiX family permuted papain-like enzyme [Ignavibacteria bacterium]|nr:YiiX family permuted papain-like enzyme [Ignavibacteria bacterium]
MKYGKIISISFIVVAILFLGYFAKRKFYDPAAKIRQADKEIGSLTSKDDIKNGDIIFQSSISAQCEAIRLATHSEYTHCGIIFKNGNDINVYEAVQPVKVTPLNKWIARGQDGHFVIKRLKNSSKVLNENVISDMISEAEMMKGKKYDIYFGWSDEKIYCSELIWKIYKRTANIEVGKLQKLKEFDLTSAPVKKVMDERYGKDIPYEETVISPASIFDSELLTEVYSNKKK